MAQAKPPSRYDVFDIGDIPAPAGWHTFKYTAFAINENNSVAGFVEMRITGSGDHTHAVFWTPVAEHGFSAFTLYDLTELAALPDEFCLDGTCDGFGYDINDADVVVGSQETDERQRGYIWNLPTNDDAGGLQTFTIGTLLADPELDRSVIHGISDASPALFVGEAEDEGPGGFCHSRPVAFRATFATTPGSLIRLDSASEQSVSYDINEAATVRAVGQRREACAPVLGCLALDDAQRWIVGGSTELLTEGSFVDTIGRATNNATQSCGDSGEITETSCPPTALFWMADGSLTVIGSSAVTPQLGALDQTQAWGMSPASESLVNVVGTNLFTDHALLWHRGATSAWAAYDLNARVIPNCPLEVLTIAHDTNSNGWVVGRGKDCFGRMRGFVLRPAVCPADLDNDCNVGASDLAIILGAWGGSPGINDPGTMLDLDQDGSIAATDLAILIGAWGDCGPSCASCEASSLCPEPEKAFAISGESGTATAIVGELFSAAIASIGFGSVDALNAWTVTAPPEQAASAVQAIADFLLAALSEDGADS